MASVTRPRRDTRERRDAVEHTVLAAVGRLLAEGESFTSLGVQRIADAAGIPRSSFYGHFAEKTTLLLRLTESATRDLFGVAATWVEDDGSTGAELETVVLALVREQRRHAPLLRAVLEVAGYEPAVAAFWRELIDGFASRLEARLERDRRAGRTRADLDPGPTAAFLAWGTERAVAMHVEREPPAADAAFARGVAAATWAAMGRAAA